MTAKQMATVEPLSMCLRVSVCLSVCEYDFDKFLMVCAQQQQQQQHRTVSRCLRSQLAANETRKFGQIIFI